VRIPSLTLLADTPQIDGDNAVDLHSGNSIDAGGLFASIAGPLPPLSLWRRLIKWH